MHRRARRQDGADKGTAARRGGSRDYLFRVQYARRGDPAGGMGIRLRACALIKKSPHPEGFFLYV